VLLPCHLDRVEHTAREFAAAAGLDESMIRLVTLAARLHDIGKADPRFQADLHGQSSLLRLGLAGFEPAELLAKSGRGASSRSVRATPENFRHEALSVALAARHPALAELDEDDRDLVFWLIGTHHGYGRPFFPPCLDPQPTTVTELASDGTVLLARADAAPLRLDQGWFERATRLNRRFGPWELARLEGVLRLADHAASAEEQRLEPDHQGKTAAEAAT
jgi:CRISPR-associated endonuclease/helicase Cas3